MSDFTGNDHVLRARAIAPVILLAANEIERERKLTASVAQALIEAGLYRMLQPRSLGGAELPIVAFVQVIEEIAKADASAAWCLAQCSACAMAAAYLDKETAAE